jgi:hypothetical protein
MMLLKLAVNHPFYVLLKYYIKKQFYTIMYMCPENLCMCCAGLFFNVTAASQICYC